MKNHCGSWLACESLDAVLQKHRVASFAGKPAPTDLVEIPITPSVSFYGKGLAGVFNVMCAVNAFLTGSGIF
jgi:hypothetical protein